MFEKEIPFYYVQIAPFAYSPKNRSEMIREIQMQTMNDVPKTGMVVVSDLVDDVKNIHPANKQDVGKRLANRFSFSNDAIGNLFSKEGLPVAPFRTDDWD